MKKLIFLLCAVWASAAMAEDWSKYDTGDWPWGQEIKNADFFKNGIYYQIIGENSIRVINSEGSFLDPEIYDYQPCDCIYFMAHMKGGDYTGDVVIPETIENDGTVYNVTEIGYGAMTHCAGLTSVTIPKTVVTVYPGAFYDANSLSTIIFCRTVPPDIRWDAFLRSQDGVFQLYVPQGSKEAYEESCKYIGEFIIHETGGAGINSPSATGQTVIAKCENDAIRNLTEDELSVYGFDGTLKARIAPESAQHFPNGIYLLRSPERTCKIIVK